MLAEFVRDAVAQRFLHRGRFEPVIEELAAALRNRGYAPSTVRVYGQTAGHFLFWLMRRKVPLSAVSEDTAGRFVTEHLPRCRCHLCGPRRDQHSARAALRQLLAVLRAKQRIPRRSSSQPLAVRRAVDRFDRYLQDTCGLSEATRIYRRRYATEFLLEVFGKAPIRIRELTPKRIIEFFTRHAERCCPGSAQVMASSLRSYLRFEQLRGHSDRRLVAAVPCIPQWRLAALPEVLTAAEMQRLFTAFDRRSPTGRRDYAMTRCVADLGLRAGEVAQLRLDSVDWQTSQLVLHRSKARRNDVLPLPTSTARALIAYLRHGRPRTTERALFVRHVVPVGKPIGPGVVRNAVRYAAQRVGLRDRCRGTHILRHTAATRMVCAGASLKEVADVLGHRCLDTTAIYTKVDLPRLSTVPLPWPGRSR